jgi:hypothetical protein
MKKLVLVLFAGITFARAHAQGQIQLGAKAGVNFATVTDNEGYSARTLVNFNAGLYLKIPVVQSFSVQPEVYYSGQGFKGYDNGTSYSEHVNYLEIPVLAKFTTRSGFYLETGPQLGFLLSANDKEEGVSTDAKPYYNSADFDWVFGAGFKIPMSPVGIDFRYNAGITNIANASGYGNGYGQPAVRNNVFQLGLTVVLWKSGEESASQNTYRSRRYH